MSEIKLLPCPFCGGAVRVVEQYNTSNGKMEYLVRCKDISCTVRPKTEWFDELEEAIRHWNTRKPMQEIMEKLEEMKGDCMKTYSEFLDGEDLRNAILIENIQMAVKEVGGINEHTKRF